MTMLSFFQAATFGRKKKECQVNPLAGIYVHQLEPLTWDALVHTTELRQSDFSRETANQSFLLIPPQQFGEALDQGHIMGYFNGLQNLAWYDVWRHSTKNFQLHFYCEEKVPYYFDFREDGLYLMIAPVGIATKPDPQDPESLIFNSKLYLKQWRNKVFKLKGNCFTEDGECFGEGGFVGGLLD